MVILFRLARLTARKSRKYHYFTLDLVDVGVGAAASRQAMHADVEEGEAPGEGLAVDIADVTCGVSSVGRALNAWPN